MNDVIFYTEFPQLVKDYPIYPAKDYKRKWVKDCAANFIKYKKRFPNALTAAKCPGLRTVMESGYIVQNWFDFTIETSGDEYEFIVQYPDSLKEYLEVIGYDGLLINSFNTKFGPVNIPTYNNLGSIIKIWTPYHIEVPEGYSLSIQPIHYDDTPSFTACYGSLEAGMNVDFNVHVYWHEKNGKIFIPAGTPLCQVVLVKNQDSQMLINVADKNIATKIKKLQLDKHDRFQI
tara:strand:+ start:511 stop:1206 length:696 start_codon:yes stop_codon:yes gene_type:complete